MCGLSQGATDPTPRLPLGKRVSRPELGDRIDIGAAGAA